MKIKGEKGCVECGYNKNLSCIEFHHKNNKTITVCKLRSNKKIIEHKDEIKECDPLCGNCHVKKSINIEKFKDLRLAISIKSRLIEEDYIPVF